MKEDEVFCISRCVDKETILYSKISISLVALIEQNLVKTVFDISKMFNLLCKVKTEKYYDKKFECEVIKCFYKFNEKLSIEQYERLMALKINTLGELVKEK